MKKIYIIKCIILIMIQAIIIGISSNVFAFEMIPDLANQDLESRKITILLNVSDLSKYEGGINVASGKLVYDKNVFEEVSINGTNGWTGAYNNSQESESFGKFMLVTTTNNATKEQEIAQINLKIKDGVKDVRTKIKLESLETSYKSEVVKAEDKELKIDITKDKIKLAEEQKESLPKEENIEKVTTPNYTIYIVIICIVIVVLMFLIFLIKFQKKRRGK